MGRSPDFIIGGTPKSGTTTIFAALAKHPKVAMSRIKEPHFFIQQGGKNPYGKFLAAHEYADLFPSSGDDVMKGEGSTWYFHNAKVAAKNIHDFNSKIRMIFCFRNPVDRCYSDYWYHVQRGDLSLKLRFEDLIEDRSHWIHDGNRYTENYRAFQDRFGDDQILPLLADEIWQDLNGAAGKCFDFLGLEARTLDALDLRENVTRYPRSPWLLKHFDVASLIPRLGGKLQPIAWGLRNKIAFSGSKAKPPMAEDVRAKLTGLYRSEIESFGDVIGQDLGHWLR